MRDNRVIRRLRRHYRKQRWLARAPQRRDRLRSFGRWLIENVAPLVVEVADSKIEDKKDER